jgi:hypothetical protein
MFRCALHHARCYGILVFALHGAPLARSTRKLTHPVIAFRHLDAVRKGTKQQQLCEESGYTSHYVAETLGATACSIANSCVPIQTAITATTRSRKITECCQGARSNLRQLLYTEATPVSPQAEKGSRVRAVGRTNMTKIRMASWIAYLCPQPDAHEAYRPERLQPNTGIDWIQCISWRVSGLYPVDMRK